MPTSRILPRDLISLIHHVELNKAGWWDQAVGRLITGAFWLSDKNLTQNELAEILRREFLVNLDQSQIQNQTQKLCHSEKLVSLPTKQYKLSEKACYQLPGNPKQSCRRAQLHPDGSGGRGGLRGGDNVIAQLAMARQAHLTRQDATAPHPG